MKWSSKPLKVFRDSRDHFGRGVPSNQQLKGKIDDVTSMSAVNVLGVPGE